MPAEDYDGENEVLQRQNGLPAMSRQAPNMPSLLLKSKPIYPPPLRLSDKNNLPNVFYVAISLACELS